MWPKQCQIQSENYLWTLYFFRFSSSSLRLFSVLSISLSTFFNNAKRSYKIVLKIASQRWIWLKNLYLTCFSEIETWSKYIYDAFIVIEYCLIKKMVSSIKIRKLKRHELNIMYIKLFQCIQEIKRGKLNIHLPQYKLFNC